MIERVGKQGGSEMKDSRGGRFTHYGEHVGDEIRQD